MYRTTIPFESLAGDFQLKWSNEYGEKLVLVIPKFMGCNWTKDNLIFRSSMWTEDGFLVSPGFKKFFNWGEKDSIVPPPDSLINCSVVEKIDGSTLIVSPFKGKTIVRTRGTFNADIFDNYKNEEKYLRRKYPKAFTPPDGITYLYEWYSPANKVVLDLGNEPGLHLIGCVVHRDYSYVSQYRLDRMAQELDVPRPARHVYDSVEGLLGSVKDLKGKEGVCIYYDGDQSIKKVKSASYLMMHTFKSELSINNLLEVYVDAGMPDYQAFYDYIANTYDFECAEVSRGLISTLADAKKEVLAILSHMQKFADSVRHLPRIEAAAKIQGAYGNTNRAGLVFLYLDNKTPKSDALKKLLHQVIPK